MKPKHKTLFSITAALAATLAWNQAHAAEYYWDTNSTTAGSSGGTTASGTWSSGGTT